MVRETFNPFFRDKTPPFLPRNNPKLTPPSGGLPLFNNPFSNQPILPDIKRKIDIQFQDLEFDGGTPTIEYQQDECGFVIRASGNGGLIKKGEVTIFYRDPKPECQPPPPLPPRPPNHDYYEYADIPRSLFPSDLWLAIPEKIYHYYSYETPLSFDILSVNCSLEGIEGEVGVSPIKVTVAVDFELIRTGLNLRYALNFGLGRHTEGYPGLDDFVESWEELGGSIDGAPWEDSSVWTLKENAKTYSFWNGLGSTTYDYSHQKFLIIYGQVEFIGARYSEFIVSSSRPVNFRRTSYHSNNSIFTIDENTGKTICLHEKPIDPPPPPPPMNCCPNQNDDLLRLVLSKIKKLSDIVGVDEYPASLPKSLITKKGKNEGATSVPNLTRLLEWYIQRFDEIIGQFEIDIEITDTDLSKEGNQSKIVRLPNIAESIAEMFTMLMQSSINTDLLVNLSTRTLTETGQDKQQNFKSHQALMAIVDYLGFNYQEKDESMPLSFKPGEKSFDKLLKETETKVRVIDYHKKETLNYYLHELLQAAAIIRAAHWRKIDASGDIGLQLLDRIYQNQGVRDKVSKLDDKQLEKLLKDLTVPPQKENKDKKP